MKISYNWLKEFIAIDESPEALAAILTATGLEVESVRKVQLVQGGLEGVVVGSVISCVKHPDADKLSVTKVDVGVSEPLQIVCGAPNVATGQKVAVALVGSTLFPDEGAAFKIKVSRIRGVESYGMLCAEDELGIGTAHHGIMVLPSELKPGMPLAEALELEDDYELEIGLTPNRADALGHIGVARDIAAYLRFHKDKKQKIQYPLNEGFISKNTLKIAISVDDPIRCPRYCGTTVNNVQIKPSPDWLQKRLRTVGLSPVNNVVDVTNYVMRELGTPLHAFDVRSLNGKIVVRTARDGDKITTLDGNERVLSETDLMITNGQDYLCIAGVFGGLHSGVKEDTTAVFLESAYFDPVSIRKTARSHGLHTDASFRFERGVDPHLTMTALKRAALMIQQIAGGDIAMEPEDHFTGKLNNHVVLFHLDHCNRLVGNEFTKEEVLTIFDALEISVKEDRGNALLLEVPAYRVDVTREVDVIEEVLRIYGLNKVEIPSKLNASLNIFPNPDLERITEVLSEMLVGRGFTEIMNNSLSASKLVSDFGRGAVNEEWNVEVLNPLSRELDVLRQTLIYGALQVIEYNQNRQQGDLKLFEFGKVYHKFPNAYVESKHLTLVLTGNRELEQWNAGNKMVGFFDAKDAAYAILQRLGLQEVIKETALQDSLLTDGIQLLVLKRKVGEIGWISNELKKLYSIRNEVFIVDFDWDALMGSLQMVKMRFKELPKTFAVRRDFSLLLDTSVAFSEIESVARNCEKKLLQDVGLFDVYEGKNMPEGKKSYAVSFTFQDPELTLKDEQIDAIMENIREALAVQLDAQLR